MFLTSFFQMHCRELEGKQKSEEDALLWAVNTFGEILAKVGHG